MGKIVIKDIFVIKFRLNPSTIIGCLFVYIQVVFLFVYIFNNKSQLIPKTRLVNMFKSLWRGCVIFLVETLCDLNLNYIQPHSFCLFVYIFISMLCWSVKLEHLISPILFNVGIPLVERFHYFCVFVYILISMIGWSLKLEQSICPG